LDDVEQPGFGQVIDKRKLVTVAVVLYSFMSTVVSVLVVFSARSEVTPHSDASECGVTAMQADVIRSVFRNGSCAYNTTVASILAGH